MLFFTVGTLYLVLKLRANGRGASPGKSIVLCMHPSEVAL
jgi:hypothetical protein